MFRELYNGWGGECRWIMHNRRLRKFRKTLIGSWRTLCTSNARCAGVSLQISARCGRCTISRCHSVTRGGSFFSTTTFRIIFTRGAIVSGRTRENAQADVDCRSSRARWSRGSHIGGFFVVVCGTFDLHQVESCIQASTIYLNKQTHVH